VISIKLVAPSKIADIIFPTFLFFIINEVVPTTESIECRERGESQNSKKYVITYGNELITIEVSIRSFTEDKVEYKEFKLVSIGRKRKLRR
jgi:hypothetical protein